MSLRHASSLVTLSASLVLGLTLAGCSSDDPPRDDGSRTGRGAAELLSGPLHVRTEVARVHGHLSAARSKQLEAETGRLLAGYLSAAYLHERGSAGYRDAFPGFTRGARELALRDVATADEVRARGAVAFLSVVAPQGRARWGRRPGSPWT